MELVKIGVTQTGKTPVCCSDTGGWYRIDNFEHWWSVWRKEHGFEGLKFHKLRHTQATQLLANGVDVKTVQTRLGHANVSITLGRYAHAILEKDHEAADLLGSLLAAKPDADEGNNDSASENTIEVPEESVETESGKCLHFVSNKDKSRHKRSRPAARKKLASLLKFWSRGADLNHRPSGYEPDELTRLLHPAMYVKRFPQWEKLQERILPS